MVIIKVMITAPKGKQERKEAELMLQVRERQLEEQFSETVNTVPFACIAIGLVFLLPWKLSSLQCYTVEGLGVLPYNDRHVNLAQK